MSDVKTLLVVGCGQRGSWYAKLAEGYRDKVRVVAVAEPRDFYRNLVADAWDVPENLRFRSWEEAAKRPKMADAVIIATQDAMHEAPVVAFANQKYDMLLEKPLAPTEDACRRIIAAVKRNDILFAVCHVLRYTPYTKLIKKLLSENAIGELVAVQHMEPVGYWHQAHSFVRGNWRNEELSSSMLLQKCCHDLDWLRYVIDRPCLQVQSFGSLYHFRREMQPAGATDRCMTCPEAVEKTCPYSAKRIYLRNHALQGKFGWPVDVVSPEKDIAKLEDALRNGPYGRCVYACDNDVVDHQIVNMNFEGGITASHLMTAFTPMGSRKTRLCGTMGYLETDGVTVKHVDFRTEKETVLDVNRLNDGAITSGHGGGDEGLMDAFIHALYEQDRTRILSGPDVSLESHLMVFAAERARKNNTIESICR